MSKKDLEDKTLALTKTLKDNEGFLKILFESVAKESVSKVKLIGCTAYIDEFNNEYIDVRLYADEVETIIRIEF